MSAPPSGTITFLFTDLERSAREWEQRPQAMERALERHDALVRGALRAHGGHVFKTVGDAFHAAFTTAPEALQAAVAIQRALGAEPWETGEPLRARIALHTGTAQERDGDYFGPALNRVARLRDAGHGGQILLSAVTAGLVRGQAPDGVELRDLGEHRLRDLTEPERVYQAAVWGLPADFPPLRLPDDHATNLPTPLTSFVGREREIAEVVALLGTARLVTLTGPGGVGKTRLALAVEGRAAARSAAFIDLAALADPSLILPTVAYSLGVEEPARGSLMDELVAALGKSDTLLVLDNLERLVEGALVLATLLARAPDVRLLVTSRVPMRLRGEREYPVPVLPVPGADAQRDLQTLATVPSVALFIARSRDVSPEFSLTTENAEAVAAICARLDGLPLAIELAAAQARVLPPGAMLDRLTRRLPLLKGDTRDAPARQRTLDDTIGWSYDLLAEDERKLLRRLGVFAGGFSLDAAEAVCGPGADRGAGVLHGIAALVAQSLVQRSEQAGGEARFVMLETIREFALDRLAESDEAVEIRARHRDCCLRLVRDPGPSWATWLTRLEADLDNLRAALAWCLAVGDLKVGLQMATGMVWFWERQGRVTEGRRWLESLVAASRNAPVSPQVLAGALSGLGQLAFRQGEYDEAVSLGEEALAISRALREPSVVAQHLQRLAHAVGATGDVRRSMALHEEASALWRELGNDLGVADTLLDLGLSEQMLGNLDRSAVLLQESLTIYDRVGELAGKSSALLSLGMASLRQGSPANAALLYREGLTIGRHLGDRQVMAWGVLGLAGVAWFRGDHEAASKLLGASEAVLEAMGIAPPPAARQMIDRGVANLRTALGDDALAALRAEGRALSLDAAVALALEQAAPDGGAP
jgi:predicted ATPase/class 3 adenylate cyclase